MDTSSYEQIHITSEALGDSKDYLIAEMLIRVEFYDVEPVGIELPSAAARTDVRAVYGGGLAWEAGATIPEEKLSLRHCKQECLSHL
jgi:hypothetical protein